MPKINESDILKEQKRAREEYIKLKKMQNGEIEIDVKNDDALLVPKTRSEKIGWFWRNYKYHIISVVVAISIIAGLVYDMTSKISYDLKIVLFTYDTVLNASCEKIADYFESFCEDINRDGEVNVLIINCSFEYDSDNTSYKVNMINKLQANFAAEPEALLYITDKSSYDYVNSIPDDTTLFEGTPITLGDDFYDACKDKNDILVLPQNLQISCRKTTDTLISLDKDIEAIYNQAQLILKQLKKPSN